MRPAVIALALSMPVSAAELEFKERFADPATRTESLGRLVPETRDWFFYRALDHQLSGRDKEFEDVLAEWRAAIDRKERPVEDEGFQALKNRSLLLAWKTNPEKAAENLIRELELTFDDTRPDAKADEKLPSSLSADALSQAAFEQEAVNAYHEEPWRGYTERRLFQELDQGAQAFPPAKRDWTLSHLKRADHPTIVALINAALTPPPNRPSASLPEQIPLLNSLTLQQMQELMRLNPRLKGHEKFVLRYLGALAPADETALKTDPAQRAAYAKLCVEFTATLPPTQASIHLAALGAHLFYQRELGNFPREDFLRYLAVPRKSHSLLRNDSVKGVEENKAFYTVTELVQPIPETELISAYLDHFLSTADSAADFAPFIEEKQLARLHSKARLLAGGDPAKWSAALDPGAFRELRELTTLTFAPGQPGILPADAQVKLALDLKNTPELLVRIYPLDLASWYSTHSEPPDTNLDLDGLVPERELRLTYAQQPLIRHRETIDLPDLKGRGSWIVETVSKGVAARALIHKGNLFTTPTPIEGGTAVRVFDETGTPVPDATLVVDGQTLTPDATGRIVVKGGFRGDRPHTYATGAGLAAPVSLYLSSSTPSLEAKFHVDREQLVANQQAKLRMALRLSDQYAEVPLDRLQKVTLTLTAKLGDGVTTQRVISDGLKPLAEQTVDFLVPPDARDISLRLTAKVAPATGGDPVELSATREFPINPLLDTEKTGTALLSLTTRGYRLDVRGRNGEPLASRAVQVAFTHRGYEKPVTVPLRTNGEGRIELGNLTDIKTLVVTGNDLGDTTLAPESLTQSSPYSPSPVVMAPGGSFRLPMAVEAGKVDRLRFRLVRRMQNMIVEDASDHLAIEPGVLVARGSSDRQLSAPCR
ncbi:MAG: hypothetical protein QM755_22270 [Luteolibacter sp.]